jgi:hypothetical protein
MFNCLNNCLNYTLDVLASRAEFSEICERLNRPSLELIRRIAERFDEPADKIAGWVTDERLLDFELVEPVDTALLSLYCRDEHRCIVDNHLVEVSHAYPKAIFLLDYNNSYARYTARRVIRAGEVVQEIVDDDWQVQRSDWALLDIFAPFKAEYYSQKEFGSLWDSWLDSVIEAATRLKERRTAMSRVG